VKHIFTNHCVDFEPILQSANLDAMLKVAYKQSTTQLARMRVDFANYKDYDTDQWCPIYFGMFGEWLCQHVLTHYGHIFNIESVTMTDSEGSNTQDYGVDGVGLTVKDKVMKSTGRKATKGSPVYIQVKSTMNKTKEYTPNDGSRLPNFGMNAMSSAITGGYAYQARYIVFTTGRGLHYSLQTMCNNMFEVIDYKQIRALINNDAVFLNYLRNSVGLLPFDVNLSPPDPEAQLISSLMDDDEPLTITDTMLS
jgi:hypothetical protein